MSANSSGVKRRNITVKEDRFGRLRSRMVDETVVARGIKDPSVIEAMRIVPRHLFVAQSLYAQAYSDFPLPIGEKQTISQPYIVALMVEALGLKGEETILEVGTGSGYQSAVLSLLCHKVYSIERVHALAGSARRVLDELLCANVIIKVGDGTLGLPEHAPYDGIIVAAGGPIIPQVLCDQLKDGASLVMPVGGEAVQELVKVTRRGDTFSKHTITDVRFVKLVGKYGFKG